jgi:hypothetical protein
MNYPEILTCKSLIIYKSSIISCSSVCVCAQVCICLCMYVHASDWWVILNSHRTGCTNHLCSQRCRMLFCIYHSFEQSYIEFNSQTCWKSGTHCFVTMLEIFCCYILMSRSFTVCTNSMSTLQHIFEPDCYVAHCMEHCQKPVLLILLCNSVTTG